MTGNLAIGILGMVVMTIVFYCCHLLPPSVVVLHLQLVEEVVSSPCPDLSKHFASPSATAVLDLAVHEKPG